MKNALLRPAVFAALWLAIVPLVPVKTARAEPPAAVAGASKTAKTVRLLTVGNSFSRNATRYLSDLATADGNVLVHQQAYIGGSTMSQHWEKAEQYEKDPQDKRGFYATGRSLKQYLLAEPWDFVTIQQASIRSHDLATYQPYAGRLYAYIHKYAPQAEILLHQTWAYRRDDPRFAVASPAPGEPHTQEEMYRGLTHAYRSIAAELGVRLIPVGDAFHRADTDPMWGYQPDAKFDFTSAQRPALPDQTHSLHVGRQWQKQKNGIFALRMDGHHANSAGEYLGGCVFYEVLFGRSAVGNSFVPPGLDPAYSRFLQETAHQTVADSLIRLGNRADVLIYGGTPAGIAASVAAASDGDQVLLVEPTARLGGMATCGLAHPDFRTFEGLNGAFLDWTRRVERHYRQTYGPDSQQAIDCFHGTHAEPKVSLLVFEQMLAEQSGVQIWRERSITSVQTTGAGEAKRIVSASFSDRMGNQHTVTAHEFIDATYEGDLLAAAGVKYRVGREGSSEYDESLAPEEPDGQLQGYNFRLTATREAANRVLPLVESGRIKTVFGYPHDCLFKAHIPRLPNGKYDINDVSRGIVRLSLPGENRSWPEGDAATRRRIFDEHMCWDVGLLYFLQNDADVPAKYRDEARQWGWCKDEFTDSNHLPPQLYVREARRMAGQYVFTEHDTDHAPGDARAVLRRDAIAMGDYGPNCHGTAHEGSRFGGKHSGEFYKSVSPYQIPYGVLVPREMANLLVPGACSASHVGFCALRLEPIWMSLGQAAGHAAHLARADHVSVREVPVNKLQSRLHADGAATIYMSDVRSGHLDFSAVQWWGTAGGFHGLAPMPEKSGQRGKNLTGQYYEAFPNHAAELDRPLDVALAEQWKKLAAELQLPANGLPSADGRHSRGDWLREVWKLHSHSTQ